MDPTHVSGLPAFDAAPHTGTTILAIEYDGGVVLGSDTRVSVGTYISNRASDKITALADNAYLLRSGSAPDTQAVADYVRYFVHQHAMELQEEPKVSTVANLVMQMNYNNKHLVGAMIIAGFDEQDGGQVYGCPIGGTLVRQPWTTDGSGSTFIWGFLDSEFKPGMTREQAERLATEAVALAMSTDSSSGGGIRLVTITKDGAERKWIPGDKVPQYHGEIANEQGPRGLIIA